MNYQEYTPKHTHLFFLVVARFLGARFTAGFLTYARDGPPYPASIAAAIAAGFASAPGKPYIPAVLSYVIAYSG